MKDYLMSIHVSMINLLISLGYTRTPGCCHGFSLRWLEACLLGEEHVFKERIEAIDNAGYSLIHWINAAINKKGQNLTENDYKFLDILSFLDGLELYQSPHRHFSTFNTPLTQDDVDIISHVASSVDILSRGGLARVYSEPGIYTKNEIKDYLDGLGLVIENACVPSKEPLGIVLSSHNHTIALTYTPGKGWDFMDINQYPSKSFQINETNVLAEHIMMGFVQ